MDVEHAFDRIVHPASTGYSGQDSLVTVSGISDSGDTMTATVSVHSTGSPPPSDDLEQRLAALEARVTTLEDAVASGSRRSSAVRSGMAGSGRSRTAGGADLGQRGCRRRRSLHAGLAAAGRAVRELLSEMQHPWSPRRRT